MPDLPKVAIFGDSHYACLRMADNAGLVDRSGVDLEYWGHVGRRFRMLEFRHGAIYPTDEVTAARFAKFNEKGRQFLPAADFDHILFMGCRIDLGGVVLGLLDALMRGQYLSVGLRRKIVRHRLDNLAAYGFARQMATVGKARIFVHPVSMFALGSPQYDPLMNEHLRRATPQARAEVWDFIARQMAQDGVEMIAQPDHTIAGGIYTDPAYMSIDAAGAPDYTHRNAAYGALIFRTLLDKITR